MKKYKGMETLSEEWKPMNREEEKYIYCNNISKWLPENYLKYAHASAHELSIIGTISYKFVGKCHLPLNRIRFIEFTRSEDVQNVLEGVRKLGIGLKRRNRSVTISKQIMNKNEKEERSESVINILNNECLIKIFQYLPLEERLEMEKVCTRWRDVSLRAWNDIRELGFKSLNDDYYKSRFFIKLLMRCGIYLNTLKLNVGYSDDTERVLPEYCHNLRTIGLNSFLGDPYNFNVLSGMKKLQSFKTQLYCLRHLEDCLSNLPNTIKSLNTAVIDIPLPKTTASLTHIFNKFNALNSLTLQLFDFQKNMLEAISEKKTITKLNLSLCIIKKNLNLITNLSNLEYLNLESVEHVDNNLLVSLVAKCDKLKHLNVSNCGKLSDDGIKYLRYLNNLEELFIARMSVNVTDYPLGKLRGLKKLHCRDCKEVRDHGIMQLIRNCPGLEELDVSDTSVSKETLQLAMNLTKHRKN